MAKILKAAQGSHVLVPVSKMHPAAAAALGSGSTLLIGGTAAAAASALSRRRGKKLALAKLKRKNETLRRSLAGERNTDMKSQTKRMADVAVRNPALVGGTAGGGLVLGYSGGKQKQSTTVTNR